MKRFGLHAFAFFFVLAESPVLADTANIQATDTVKDYWIPLIAALVGAIIGGTFVLMGTYWANCHSLHRDAIERQKNINGVLRAIKNELEILGEVYSNQIGKALEFVNEGEVFSVRLSLQNEYFIVYPKNTHLVGQIDDVELVKSIIFTYNAASVLIDAFWINNKYIEESKQPKSPIDAGPFINQWKQQTLFLKSLHKNLHTQTESLLKQIDAYLLDRNVN